MLKIRNNDLILLIWIKNLYFQKSHHIHIDLKSCLLLQLSGKKNNGVTIYSRY